MTIYSYLYVSITVIPHLVLQLVIHHSFPVQTSSIINSIDQEIDSIFFQMSKNTSKASDYINKL